MSVIVVGDRAVGKTTMVHYISDPKDQDRVIVEDGPDPSVKDERPPTEELEPDTPIKMVVNLPIKRQIQVQWTDTPGEAFTRKQWRQDQPSAWDGLKTKMNQSCYLILLLPPHQGIIKESLLTSTQSKDEFPKPEIWQNRMEEWLNFLSQECPKVKHLLICLHKADLVCDNIGAEADRWRYQIDSFSWNDYSSNIKRTYFNSLHGVIFQYQRKHRGQLVSFFMTTIKQRALLELPWLYIGSYEKPTVN